jgi:hypothetical protein
MCGVRVLQAAPAAALTRAGTGAELDVLARRELDELNNRRHRAHERVETLLRLAAELQGKLLLQRKGVPGAQHAACAPPSRVRPPPAAELNEFQRRGAFSRAADRLPQGEAALRALEERIALEVEMRRQAEADYHRCVCARVLMLAARR